MPNNASCRVTDRREQGDYVTLWLRNDTLAAAAPGQFCQVRLPGEDFHLRLPISIHDAEADRFALLVKVIGQGTARLAQVRPGDLLEVMGPLGRSFSVPPSGRVLLVSGGIGYAPLRLLKRRLRPGCATHWLHGGRTAADLFPADEQFTDDGLAARKGLVTDGLREALAASDWQRVFACGPHPMLRACAALCREHNVSLEVSLEAYMACGIGVCHGCVAPAAAGGYLTVCKQGPVFDAQEVNWDE